MRPDFAVTRAVDGWLEAYSQGVERRGGNVKYSVGTTEYMRTAGGHGVTLECGQHDDPQGSEVAYAAIRRTLAHLDLTGEAAPAPAARMETVRLCTVVDRQHRDDRFERPWNSFDPVCTGDVIGRHADGTLETAPRDGCVVFPNGDAESGNERFYFAEPRSRL